MTASQNLPRIPLPRGWARSVKSAMLNVIALAQYAATYTRSWAVTAPSPGCGSRQKTTNSGRRWSCSRRRAASRMLA